MMKTNVPTLSRMQSKLLLMKALVMAFMCISLIGNSQNYPSALPRSMGGIPKITPLTAAENNLQQAYSNTYKGTSTSDWDPDFVKKIGFADGAHAIDFGEFAQCSDGSIVYTLTNGRPEFALKAQIVKLDASGNELWMTEFSTYEVAKGSNIAVDANNDIFISGMVERNGLNSELFVAKYSSTGTKIWEQFIYEDYFAVAESKKILLDETGNIYCIGEVTSGLNGAFLVVTSLNNAGTLKWTTKLSPGNGTSALDYVLAYFNNGEIVVRSSAYGVSNDYPCFTRIAADGSILQNTQSTTAKSSKIKKSGDFLYWYYVLNNTYTIQKTDLSGQIIWTNNIPLTYMDWGRSIYIDGNQNVYAFVGNGTSMIVYAKYNSAGDQIFKSEFIPQAFSDFFGDAIFANSTGKIFIAGKGSLAVTYVQRVGIISFDKTGTFLNETIISPSSTRPHTFAYDYTYYNDKLFIGGLQYGVFDGLWEQGRQLFVSAVDSNSVVLYTDTTMYENKSNLFIWGSDMDASGNIYHAANSSQLFKVVKQSSAGDIVWAKNYFTDYQDLGCANVSVTNDNCAVVAGYGVTEMYGNSKGLIIKLDENGNEKWKTILTGENKTVTPQYIKIDNEGNYIVASNSSLSDYIGRILITKISPSGEIVWEYVNMNSSPSGSQVYYLEIAPNNDILFGGIDYDSQWQNFLYAERISAAGSQVWEYHNADVKLVGHAVADNDGNIYLTGNTATGGVVIKMNASGETDWTYTKENGYFYNITINKNDASFIYASGSFMGSDGFEAVITALTASSNIAVWESAFKYSGLGTQGSFIESDNNYLYQACQSLDPYTEINYAGIVAYNFDGTRKAANETPYSVGEGNYTRLINISQNQNNVALSLQSNALSHESGGLGIVIGLDKAGVNTSVEVNAIDNSCTVFPNPANESFTISSKNAIEKVEIYNVQGVLVFQKLINANTYSINIGDFANGIYNINITTSNGVVNKRLAVTK